MPVLKSLIRRTSPRKRPGRGPVFESLEPRYLLDGAGLPVSPPEPTNLILLIGDGMGAGQIAATEAYLGRDLSFTTWTHRAGVATGSADAAVTDSAAAATAMATGRKVANGVLSLEIPGSGAPLRTSLEIQRDAGKSTGLVTTTHITHATPAAFGAHEARRTDYEAIGRDLLTESQPNVLLGGGGYGVDPGAARAAGYTVVRSAADLWALDPDTETHLSGQFGTGHLPYALDGRGELPDLAAMTATALEVLAADPDGFFLMVEGGRIDHASHAHDLPRTVGEVADFDAAVSQALTWAGGRSDTLILVTADHETGGLQVTNRGSGRYPAATWGTSGHTDQAVGLWAWGLGAEAVEGTLENTAIFGLTAPGAEPSGPGTVLPVVDPADPEPILHLVVRRTVRGEAVSATGSSETVRLAVSASAAGQARATAWAGTADLAVEAVAEATVPGTATVIRPAPPRPSAAVGTLLPRVTRRPLSDVLLTIETWPWA